MHEKNMMVLLALALFLCVFTAPELRAEKAIPEEMELVCRNWLSYMIYQKGTWSGDTHPQIMNVNQIVEGDMVLARCFSISPRGFVVVPILKELPPITVYSDECDLDLGQEVGFPQMIREILLHRIRLYVKIYGSLDAVQPSSGEVLLGQEHREEWNEFLKSENGFKTDMVQGKLDPLTQVGPLLTTYWSQDSPYNNFCPMGDGGRCLVGCAATAAAQIMRYHNWPPSGTGSHSYTWNGDQSCGGNVGGGTLSATFSDAYDWQDMPNDCQSGCTQAQQDALAELCYEVGVAFQMDYGKCASSASTATALTVFPTYFRYDTSIDKEDRVAHSPSEWFSIIQTEINSGRPMLYRIFGHAMVCDGWRDTGGQNQYHMNYGWGGSYTAWYTIDDLYCPWAGCDPMVEYIIRNIIPWDVRCGCTITSNTVLDHDLWDCPTGITIGADNITIDGNGHVIDGIGSGSGVYLSGKHNVTFKNCKIREFKYGVELSLSSNDTLINNVIYHNSYNGIILDTSSSNMLINNNADSNGHEGIKLVDSDNNTLTGNTTNNNIQDGILLLISCSHNVLTDNESNNNSGDGITIRENSDSNSVTNNTVGNNTIDGIVLGESSSSNTISANRVFHNGRYGAYLKNNSQYNSFWRNEFTDNDTSNAYEEEGAGNNTWDTNDTGNYWSDCLTNPGYPYSYEIPGPGNGIDYHPYYHVLVGDANYDGIIDVGDVIYLINYLFKGGPLPYPLLAGDADCIDGEVAIGDVVYLLNYLFKGGPAINCPKC